MNKSIQLKLHLAPLTCCLFLLGFICQGAEVYETMKIGDTVQKNVRVVSATPACVTIVFDGGGASIKRQDLPPPLKEKYPYDPDKAAAFERHRAEQERARRIQEQANAKASFARRERELLAKIADLENDLVELQKEMIVLNNRARGRSVYSPERMELTHAQDKKLDLLRQIHQLKMELKGNRAAQAQCR